ncbi:MAG: metallophosphoesterase [Chitinophagaceae bacterium]|nr:metallophosphoesterase [Chitinophagaceae bacterium]
MKQSLYLLLPLFFAGFVVQEDNCSNTNAHQQPVQGSQFDGPYVLYLDKQLFVKYVYDDSGTRSIRVDSFPLAQKETLQLTVATDIPGKTFPVTLKKGLENEKTDFPDVKKMFVVSDIEGNFAAFRKLLQAQQIIDSSFNWAFGNGHLVLTGDFFDRGAQVTEVLWLIYSLEEKAKAAGGYVHFILGNHEIMNMSGDIRYVHPKYTDNALLMNEGYMNLFSEHSELGAWLRTKNIVEKVGPVLFVHGGISAEVNNSSLSAAKMNKLARPFYPDSSYNYKDNKVALLYSDLGPFWYRGYYTGKTLASQAQVDSTLDIYGVKYIATGHTVVADTISVRFNKKLFNTDVHHAKGHTEGLYYEEGRFYRATPFGEKFEIAD